MNDVNNTIYELELSLLKPETRSSFDLLNGLIADDFIEFGSSGSVYNKKEILDRLPTSADKVEYTISDFNVRILSDSMVQTTFKTDRIINGTEKLTSLRSSIWRKTNDNWQMFFHQGTPVC